MDLDCADMSLILLIEFAAGSGLPVTFWDNKEVRYISKATRQTPKDSRSRSRHGPVSVLAGDAGRTPGFAARGYIFELNRKLMMPAVA
jgi:hypothetical protein